MNISSLKIEEVPEIIKGKPFKNYTLKDKKFIAGMLLIKELVQISYQKQSKIMTQTIQKKREYGYCGGFIYCLEFTGKHYMCASCKKQKKNPKYAKKQSQYGKLRQAERNKRRVQKEADSLR